MSGDTSDNTTSPLKESKLEVENVDGSLENLGLLHALNASEALRRIESNAELHEDNSQNALFSCSSSDNCDSKDVAIERALNLELSENNCELALDISQNSDTTPKTVEDADLEEPNLEIILSDDDYKEHDSACGKSINFVNNLHPTNVELSECEQNSENGNSDHKALESDIKLRLGCFIKLVDCQVLLKSMIATPDVPSKNKKRKLSGGTGSKKLKLKKHDTRQEPECFSTHKFKTSKSQNLEPMPNSTTLLSDVDTPQTSTNILHDKQGSGSIDNTYKIDEGKHISQICSTNDSNIFTNMASFFLSASSEEHKPPLTSDNCMSSSEVGTNVTEKFNLEASQQPIVRLFRLPSTQLTKDEQSQRNDNNHHSKSQKKEDLSKNEKSHKESYQANLVDVTSKEEEELQFPFVSLHSKDDKFSKTKKRKHSKVSKSEKSLLKSTVEKDGLRKSFLNETKKLKADEALKKLQDVIGIKPISTQGSIISKRIPKINQNVFGNAQSSSVTSDKERRNPLELGAESLQSVQNQLEGAGWTRHKFSRSDKSNNPPSSSMPSRRNSNWERSDCGYQKRPDFATSRKSPIMSDRKTFKDEKNSSESHLNGSFYGADNGSRFSNVRRNAHSSTEMHRSSSRQTPLPSLQNFSTVSNISCDVQFLLKACNAIIDNNSNLSSEHQQQFNSACNRLRDELEKLVHSSGNTPFQSPSSRISLTNSPTASLKDFNVDEIMGFLKPHLPQDIYEKFSKDVSRMGSVSQSTERFHPISPQSSTSSTSHKDSFLPHSSPKCFSLVSKKCASEIMLDGMKTESGKANNQQLMEERLLKKMEKEIQILETLIRVQDQLSVADHERTDGCASDPDDSKPSKDEIDSQICNSTSKSKSDGQATEPLQKTENSLMADKDPACNLCLRAPSSPAKHKNRDESSRDQPNLSQSSEEKDKDKKLEEKIIALSRNALKSYYHKGNITSEEFKIIMKKAITKISESKCKDVSQPKVSRFIDSLVSNVISKRKKINN